MPNRLFLARTGRQPIEVALAVVSIISGASGLLAPATVSPAVSAVLFPPWQWLYLGLLVLGGIVVLWGMIRSGISGLLLERKGLGVLGMAFTVLVLCIVGSRGWAGVVSALIPGVFLVCIVARIVQIGHDLKLLRTIPGPAPLDRRGSSE